MLFKEVEEAGFFGQEASEHAGGVSRLQLQLCAGTVTKKF